MPGYGSYTNEELLSRLKHGDTAAFTEVHNRFYALLYRHAYNHLPDREEVKDILQDLFTQLWNNRAIINVDQNLAGYLYTAIRNRLLNSYKRQKIRDRYIHSLQSFINNQEPEPDESIRLKQMAAIIEAAVAKLPPKMRLVFELSRNGKLSHQQIADKLGLSVLTVRKQINNSLKTLRLKLRLSPDNFLFFICLIYSMLPS